MVVPPKHPNYIILVLKAIVLGIPIKKALSDLAGKMVQHPWRFLNQVSQRRLGGVLRSGHRSWTQYCFPHRFSTDMQLGVAGNLRPLHQTSWKPYWSPKCRCFALSFCRNNITRCVFQTFERNMMEESCCVFLNLAWEKNHRKVSKNFLPNIHSWGMQSEGNTGVPWAGQHARLDWTIFCLVWKPP